MRTKTLTQWVGVRLNPTERQELERVVEELGTTASQFLRLLVRRELRKWQKSGDGGGGGENDGG